MDIIFKKVNESDYTQITKLYNYYVINSSATYHINQLTNRETIDFFGIGNPDTYDFGIINEGNFCGFCLLRPYSKKEGYKYTYEISIYINDENKKKGIGKIAVNYLDEIAKQKKIKTIVAGICSENTASIRLFEKCEYERCGYFKNMGFKYGRLLDNVYYQKCLWIIDCFTRTYINELLLLFPTLMYGLFFYNIQLYIC